MGFLTGNTIGGALARTALSALALNQISRSVMKSNDSRRDASPVSNVRPGVRLQLPPTQDHHIPVLYGEAIIPGIISDAHLSTNRQTMTYVFTIAEKTGTKISDDLASTYIFRKMYWADQLVVFKADGITIDYTLDRDGNQDISLRGLATVRFYAGGSASSYQLAPEGDSITATNAWSVVPNWTTDHAMPDLLFAVVTITYNQDKGNTGVPTLLFHVVNSMTLPGDCLYDYTTNTRYGAGIAAGDINRE